MSTVGTGGNRGVRDGKLPAGYRPPGGGQGNPASCDSPTDGAYTPPIPAYQAASGQMQVVENLKVAVEALQRRLTAQEQTKCWDLKLVPLSYSHNTGVNGPGEFKLIVQN